MAKINIAKCLLGASAVLALASCAGEGGTNAAKAPSFGSDTTSLKVVYVRQDSLLQHYNLFKELSEENLKKEENVRATLNAKQRELEKDAQEFQYKLQNNAYTTQARAEQEQAALPEAVADKCPPYAADICPPERELEKEKEIDIELEIKREGEIKTGQTAPAPFGRYENVFLSEKELAELQEELPGKWEYYIDRLSGYIASSGKKYKNHAATIRRWAADDRAKGKPKKGIPDYSYKEGESL